MQSAFDELLKPRVWCPHCRKRTDCIQVYDVPIGLCFLVYVVWDSERLVGCPRCIRADLWKRFLWNIPMMNVLCWVFAPWIAVQLISSYAGNRPGVPPEYQHLAEPPITNPSVERWQGSAGRGNRWFLILLLLAAAVGFAFFVLPRVLPH